MKLCHLYTNNSRTTHCAEDSGLHIWTLALSVYLLFLPQFVTEKTAAPDAPAQSAGHCPDCAGASGVVNMRSQCS